MNRIKIIKGIGLFFAAGITILLVSTLVVYSNKEALKNHLIKTLNRELATELNTKSISISFWKNFPSVSIVFDEVRLKQPKNFTPDEGMHLQNLAFIKTLSFSFNLFGAIRENYILNKVIVEHATFNLYVNKMGQNNWDIFNESDKEKSTLDLQLPDIDISEASITYTNKSTPLTCSFHIQQSDWKAGFSSGESIITGMIDADLDEFKNEELHWRNLKNLSLYGSLIVKKKGWEIRLNKLLAGSLNIGIKGSISGKDNEHAASLTFSSDNLTYKSVKSYLKPEWVTLLNPYDADGIISNQSTLYWKSTSVFNWQYQGEFSSKNIRFSIPNHTDLKLQASVKGTFRFGNNEKEPGFLKINQFAIQTKEFPFVGKFNWLGPDWNILELSAEGSLPLAALTSFTDTSINNLKGNLKLMLHGAIDLNKDKNLMLQALSGNFEIREAGASMNNHSIQNIFVKGYVSKGDLTIRELRLDHPNFAGIVFKGNISMPKAEFDAINIKGSLQIKQVTFPDPKGSTQSAGFALPEKWNIQTGLEIGSFRYKDFEAASISGSLFTSLGSIQLNRLAFRTCNGNVNGNVRWEKQEGKSHLQIDASAGNIDLKKLFSAFNNFSQKNITSENIEGHLSAQIQLQCPFNEKAEFISNGILMQGTYSIESGRLKEVKSLYNLSEYIDLDELKDIAFENMKGELMIRNSKVIFPETDILNSALNVKLNGEHYFDGKIDYNFSLSLTKILAGKFKKRNKNRDEFGTFMKEENQERLEIGIHMYGTTENPRFEIKKGSASNLVKTEMKKERETIKKLWKNRKDEDQPDKQKISFEESLSYFSEETNPGQQAEKEKMKEQQKDKEREGSNQKKSKKILQKREQNQEFSGNSDDFN